MADMTCTLMSLCSFLRDTKNGRLCNQWLLLGLLVLLFSCALCLPLPITVESALQIYPFLTDKTNSIPMLVRRQCSGTKPKLCSCSMFMKHRLENTRPEIQPTKSLVFQHLKGRSIVWLSYYKQAFHAAESAS